MRYITIGEYNNFSMDNPARSTRGSATYRLLLSLPGTPRSYTLALPEIFSSYSLYIGGEKILQLGDPDPDNYLARIGNRTVSFTASGVTELLLQVTNYSHFYSGLTYPPLLGEPYAVSPAVEYPAAHRSVRPDLHGFVRAAFPVLQPDGKAVHHDYFRASVPVSGRVYQLSPALYLFHHKPPALVYAGASVHLRHVSADYHPAAISAGEKAPPLLRHAATAFPVLRCGHSLLPVSAPSGNTSYNFSRVSFAVKILTALYLLWHAASTVYYGETVPGLLLTCTIIFAASLLSDLLMPYYEPILGKWFPEYGGLILVGAIGYTLWKDFTLSYQFRLTFAEEKRQLTKQVAIQKAHYLELTEKIEESAKQRHDQRHHLRTLYSFLSAGETRKAMDYLETYILTTMGQERAILCSNLVIDAILQYYKNLCDRQGIAFETKMELPPDLPVSDTELSILFGNLLENAWEACCREKTNQYITVRGKYKKGKLYVQLENSCTSPPLIKKGKFISSKNGKYGLGTQSVRNVVSQYDGLVEFDQTDQSFRVSVILPLPAENAQST